MPEHFGGCGYGVETRLDDVRADKTTQDSRLEKPRHELPATAD
jgi:hypothetical protein